MKLFDASAWKTDVGYAPFDTIIEAVRAKMEVSLKVEEEMEDEDDGSSSGIEEGDEEEEVGEGEDDGLVYKKSNTDPVSTLRGSFNVTQEDTE